MYNDFLNFFAGIQENTSTTEIYEKTDRSDRIFTRKFFWFNVFTVCFFIIPNLNRPIANHFFGWPKNDLWRFPYAVM